MINSSIIMCLNPVTETIKAITRTPMPSGIVMILPRRFPCDARALKDDFIFVCSVRLELHDGVHEERNVFRDSKNKYHVVKSE